MPRSFALGEKYVRLIGNGFRQNLGENITAPRMQSRRKLIQEELCHWQNDKWAGVEHLTE